MNTNHWHRLFNAWSNLSTPVRVSAEVLAAIKAEVVDATRPILVLGLTNGLMDAGFDVTAVDQSRALIGDLWQGSTPGRRVVVGDWLSLPFAAASFTSCIGDGSLISFNYPDRLQQVLDEVARCLRPGGKFACRVFLAPDAALGFADVDEAAQRRQLTFQHFKFRFAMAICAELGNPNIRISSIPEYFDERYPDRDRLAAGTGWNRAEIDTIDVYGKSQAIYAFPTRAQCLSIIPNRFIDPRFVPVPNHPFGDQWPILTMEVR